MKHIGKGITRTVFATKRYAIKFPGSYYKGHGYGHFARGWLANQSEWKQRKREDVCHPVFTFFHFALIMPIANTDGQELYGDVYMRVENKKFVGYIDPSDRDIKHADELKASSWGLFGIGEDEQWLLLDYDRCYKLPRKGLINRLYWWNEERKALGFP